MATFNQMSNDDMVKFIHWCFTGGCPIQCKVFDGGFLTSEFFTNATILIFQLLRKETTILL